MKNEISTRISPEGLEVANAYLELGNIQAVCVRLKLDEGECSEILAKREVKGYIDQVYLDTGYRNRFKLATALDDLIDRKMEEAEESEIYSNKDLADLLQMAHKMRMDEIKAQAELEKAKASNIKSQTNVQINGEVPFGQGNYGELMKKLLKEK
jgi:hypothetical protein|tara:strand:+ start:399 stop:860 length:462 start_codon:yes stop_codon:yes gene_type:complete